LSEFFAILLVTLFPMFLRRAVKMHNAAIISDLSAAPTNFYIFFFQKLVLSLFLLTNQEIREVSN